LHLIAEGWELLGAGINGMRNRVMQRSAYEGLQTFLSRTYDALCNGDEPPVSFADMDRVSRLIDALVDEANRI
jgi:hypothetical protein